MYFMTMYSAVRILLVWHCAIYLRFIIITIMIIFFSTRMKNMTGMIMMSLSLSPHLSFSLSLSLSVFFFFSNSEGLMPIVCLFVCLLLLLLLFVTWVSVYMYRLVYVNEYECSCM